MNQETIELLRMATWNELNSCLKQWEKVNDELEQGIGGHTVAEHSALRHKINSLMDRLDSYNAQIKQVA